MNVTLYSYEFDGGPSFEEVKAKAKILGKWPMLVTVKNELRPILYVQTLKGQTYTYCAECAQRKAYISDFVYATPAHRCDMCGCYPEEQ